VFTTASVRLRMQLGINKTVKILGGFCDLNRFTSHGLTFSAFTKFGKTSRFYHRTDRIWQDQNICNYSLSNIAIDILYGKY